MLHIVDEGVTVKNTGNQCIFPYMAEILSKNVEIERVINENGKRMWLHFTLSIYKQTYFCN